MTSASPYFLAIAITALVLCLLFVWRGRRRTFDEGAHGGKEESSLPLGWDPVISELSARIFDSQDSEFVAGEAPQEIARLFRRERAALALEWLLEVRKQVNLLMRAHRRASRGNPSIRPSSELRLGFEFLLFQVTSGILYLAIWLIGPLHAARFVGYSLELAGQFRKMTEEMLPAGHRVAAELLDIDPRIKNRPAAP
jgi:hypothetical protein